MEKNIVKKECESKTTVSKPKKHNSKRRKCKKNQSTIEAEISLDTFEINHDKKYLCSTFSRDRREKLMETSKAPTTSKGSTKREKTCIYENQYGLIDYAANGHFTVKDLKNLLANLRVNNRNQLLEYLNNDHIKKKLLPEREVKKYKNSYKFTNETGKNIEYKKSKENFKLERTKNNSNFVKLDSENASLETACTLSDLKHVTYYTLSENNELIKNVNHINDHFDSEIKTKVLSKVASCKNDYEHKKELVKTQGLSEIYEDNKRLILKQDHKEKFYATDRNQKNFLNLKIKNIDINNSTASASVKSEKNKKKIQNSKNLKFNTQSDMKFPNYLTHDELKSISNFGVLLSGIIRINQKNYNEAYITTPDKGMDILIEGLRDRNRALEGDEVYLVLKPKEYLRSSLDTTDIQRTAVVVAIKAENHSRRAVGTLHPIQKKNVNYALFFPRDVRLPRMRIKRDNWPAGFAENSESFKSNLYFARVSQWSDLRFAEGEILAEVGLVGDIEAETEALLLSNDLNTVPYSDDLLQYIPPITSAILEKEIKNRKDFRQECVFTIDPASAVDLDDAVSCKQLPNGNYEVGVHISDVTYYLSEGTPLDLAVSKRATTVYLVQRAYHMLPAELCRLCSLTPGEDKLTFSVIWEITPECQIISCYVARTVINSCAQLSYNQVQTILKNVPSSEIDIPKLYGNHSLEKVKNCILVLHKLAANFRYKRFSNGALRIDQKKIIFSLNENQLPYNFKAETHEESHQLIEEFMLLANISVAERLNKSFPQIAFLRSHSPPLDYVLKKLQKILEKYGIILDISSAGSLHASLLKYAGYDMKSTAQMLVLNNLMAKPMCRANYYCSGLYQSEAERQHYALNVPLYTHFTSPIRRYADIMTHRLLAASISNSSLQHWTINYVQRIASNCNKQKYAAKLAGEMSTELFFAVYVGLKGVFQCDAVVSDMKDRSFDCIVLSTGTHQRIYFKDIKAELRQEKNNEIKSLVVKWSADNFYEEAIQIIQIFSIVKIELRRAKALKIEATLLRCQ